MQHEIDPTRPGPARDRQATQAAFDSVDVARLLPGEEENSDPLLPGENPTAAYREDVELWIDVYSELLDFKRFMLDGASARASEMLTAIARNEIEDTDLRVARAEAERFTRRLSFWRGRLEALPASEPAG
jgi:hypothetical protein